MRASIMNFAAACRRNARKRSTPAARSWTCFRRVRIPERYKSRIDVRRFSPDERIVFLPYGEEIYAKTQSWLQNRGIFKTQASPAAAPDPVPTYDIPSSETHVHGT